MTHACSVVNEFKLFVTLQTVVQQAPLSKGFSRQEYWSGLSCPAPGDLPDSGIKPKSRCISCIAGRIFITEPLEKPRFGRYAFLNVFQYLLYLFITSPWAIHRYTLCQQLQLICCRGSFLWLLSPNWTSRDFIQDIQTPLLELYPRIPLFESLSILHSYFQLLVLASHFLTVKVKYLSFESIGFCMHFLSLFSAFVATLHEIYWITLGYEPSHMIKGLEIISCFCLHRGLHVYILKITFTQEKILIIFKRSRLFFCLKTCY